MPFYVYKCKNGHETDSLRKVEDRHNPTQCDTCAQPATLEVQTSVFDPRMGLDQGFPSAYDKWAKVRRNAAKGK